MRAYALCAVEAGFDLIRALLRRGVSLSGVIALSDERPATNVAGYRHPRDLEWPLGVPIHFVDDYRLLANTDRARLSGLEIDLLIVVGWQRLVPRWLIAQCRKGVVGLHGSALGITRGRGRSPQNWALICGAAEFEVAVFRIDDGVDSGPILATRRFPYTAHDDIVSSYQKSMLLGADMLASLAEDWDGAAAGATAQEQSLATYLPQRTAEDGALDWTLTMDEVRRHVSALTRPYPGAYSLLGDGRITIWRARPIGDVALAAPGVPGEIINLAEGGRGFIVRVGDGYMMVDDYELDDHARPAFAIGRVIRSTPFATTIARIIERHRIRSPGQPLSPEILRLLDMPTAWPP